MKLTLEGIKNTTVFQKAGILLPGYDVAAVSKKAKQAPRWAHFGIGNIFRIFIGGIADGLLEAGVLDRGLTCIETFDYDVVDKIYTPYDNLGLSVILHADGTRTYKVLGSMAEAVKAQVLRSGTLGTPEGSVPQQRAAAYLLYNYRERLCSRRIRRHLFSIYSIGYR